MDMFAEKGHLCCEYKNHKKCFSVKFHTAISYNSDKTASKEYIFF